MKPFSSLRERTDYVIKFGVTVCLVTALSSCASYYQENLVFNKEFERGDLSAALATLQKNDHKSRRKTQFIYYANQGLLLSMLGRYEESNHMLEKAYIFGEDYRLNYFNEAASYLINPTIKVYRGEDHEHFFVLYFKALNFLKLGKYEEALVECRRLNIRINQLSDKYKVERKFQRDAFIHALMGIIYQASKDYNNAFIAYRNAVDIYEQDYAERFNVTVPEQLKVDLLNTAFWTGFHDEYKNYKTKFQMEAHIPEKPFADLVFFWHNGLTPIKDEWGINFVIQHQSDDLFVFTNEDLGLSFPFEVDDDEDKSGLESLEVFRVVFPRYVERPQYYRQATLQLNDSTYGLHLAEDINQIAFYSLQQRMAEEFAKGLLRAALKKAAEHSMREENESLGAVMGIVNAITEKADTRNWQTLPHSIYYSRLPLAEGENDIVFSLRDKESGGATYNFSYLPQAGQTLVHTFSSLEAEAPAYRRYY